MKLRCLLGFFATGLFCIARAADTVEEKFPSGKVKIRYVTDKEDRKQGTYTEFTEKGQKKLTAVYKDGKLHGGVTHYETGKPLWTQTFKDGQPAYGRTFEQIKKKLADIDPTPTEKPATMAEEREAALRRLKGYRYLANVPFENMALNKALNERCEAGAKLCEMTGKIAHEPANPGLPEIDYKFAFAGTSQSNLYKGSKEMRKSVDAYMFDSDEKNIAHVGHRRWCLNPAMQLTGFGRSDIYHAMWSADKSQKIIPDYNMVAYPSAGFMPAEYFGPRHAWHVSFNPLKFRLTKAATAKIFKIDEFFRNTDEVKLDFMNVNFSLVAISNCLIFRPEAIDLTMGSRYLVEIEGLALATGVPLPTQRYVVEFVRLD